MSGNNEIKEGWDCRTLNDIMAEVHRQKTDTNKIPLENVGNLIGFAMDQHPENKREMLIKAAAIIIIELEK